MKYLIWLFLIPCGFSQEIEREFTDFYYSNQISSRHCGRNISNFVKHLESKKIDTSEIDVIKITAEATVWGFGKIIALNSRWGRELSGHFVENWGFHVIATYRGQVLDFSFGKEPSLLSMDEYLERMFIASEPLLLYGSTFRIRGEGPYYSIEQSKDHTAGLVFEEVD